MKILVREFDRENNVLKYVWKEIDRKKPFSSYGDYHTKDDKNYGCFNILKISGDYRKLGYVRCKNCGEVFKRGKEEQHYAASEDKAKCATCSCLIIHPITGKQKITLKSDGTAVCTTINTPYCGSKSRYNCTKLDEVDKPEICRYFKCRRKGIEDLSSVSDFMSEHPNPYKNIITENAVIKNGWVLNRQTDDYRSYTNGRLTAFFDINGIIDNFLVAFRNDTYKFKYSDVYDIYMNVYGEEFTWGGMADRTAESCKKLIRKLYE